MESTRGADNKGDTMNCTKCKSKIEKGQKYHRTKKGAHHADCPEASPCETNIIGRACEKCGNNNLYIRYKNKGDYLDLTLDGYDKGKAKEECLAINCKTCQYFWTEKIGHVR